MASNSDFTSTKEEDSKAHKCIFGMYKTLMKLKREGSIDDMTGEALKEFQDTLHKVLAGLGTDQGKTMGVNIYKASLQIAAAQASAKASDIKAALSLYQKAVVDFATHIGVQCLKDHSLVEIDTADMVPDEKTTILAMIQCVKDEIQKNMPDPANRGFKGGDNRYEGGSAQQGCHERIVDVACELVKPGDVADKISFIHGSVKQGGSLLTRAGVGGRTKLGSVKESFVVPSVDAPDNQKRHYIDQARDMVKEVCRDYVSINMSHLARSIVHHAKEAALTLGIDVECEAQGHGECYSVPHFLSHSLIKNEDLKVLNKALETSFHEIRNELGLIMAHWSQMQHSHIESAERHLFRAGQIGLVANFASLFYTFNLAFYLLSSFTTGRGGDTEQRFRTGCNLCRDDLETVYQEILTFTAFVCADVKLLKGTERPRINKALKGTGLFLNAKNFGDKNNVLLNVETVLEVLDNLKTCMKESQANDYHLHPLAWSYSRFERAISGRDILPCAYSVMMFSKLANHPTMSSPIRSLCNLVMSVGEPKTSTLYLFHQLISHGYQFHETMVVRNSLPSNGFELVRIKR
jgi:hypothetical protein